MTESLLAAGITGLYVAGSTGEGPSLTFAERKEVAEVFTKAAGGAVPVVIQVGHESLNQARQLAAHAQAIGASATSAVGPVYFKPNDLETLVESMAFVAAGAPDLPFYYYHIPSMTDLQFSMPDFLQVGRQVIPNLAGIKFSSPTLQEYQACVEFENGAFDIPFGVDEMLLTGLTAGARGAVGSTYNYAAKIYQKMWQAYAAKDMRSARKHQSLAQAIVRLLFKYEPRGAQRAIMTMIGLDCGAPRLPGRALSGEQTKSLRQELEALDFFSWQ